MSKVKNVKLLIIDPQNDFCDIAENELPVTADNANKNPSPIARPALPVAGGDADMKRLARFIDHIGPQLEGICVTLDSHSPIDIAHPTWWQNEKGESPAPFKMITAEDVRNGVWRSRDAARQAGSLAYVEALEKNKRYLLVIWPEHCLIGSWGHNVHNAVKTSLDRWARSQLKPVDFVTKGANPNTEHYSAVQAEVPDPKDESTQLNRRLIESLASADLVIVAGEALSHCVANTVRDIANNIAKEDIRKLVLLTDCASSVGGFEKLGADFVAELTSRGMQTSTSEAFRI